MKPSIRLMKLAIAEAKRAQSTNNYPIGAVVTRGGKIIASSPNVTRTYNDPTRHAELEAIQLAVKTRGTKFLPGCVLYTTHEPCTMCSTAAVWVKLDAIVYGCTQGDMKKFAQRNQDVRFPWRTVEISASEVIKHSGLKIELFPKFMRDECLSLFEA